MKKEGKTMIKYVTPSYEKEGIETEDIILTSLTIKAIGEDTLGDITGQKAVVSTLFSNIR